MTPAPKPTPRPKRRGHRDPVTPDVAGFVASRDLGCIGPRAGLPGACDGPLELDHVLTSGLSRRGPSEPGNLATLCRWHHRYKTEHAREARPLILALLERFARSILPPLPGSYPQSPPNVDNSGDNRLPSPAEDR